MLTVSVKETTHRNKSLFTDAFPKQLLLSSDSVPTSPCLYRYHSCKQHIFLSGDGAASSQSSAAVSLLSRSWGSVHISVFFHLKQGDTSQSEAMSELL